MGVIKGGLLYKLLLLELDSFKKLPPAALSGDRTGD